MSELVPGGNLPLPEGAVTVRVPGPFDVSALVTDDGGKVGGDADFVFYNQPSAPGARLSGDTLTIDPRRLRADASRVTVVVSPADPGTPWAGCPPRSFRSPVRAAARSPGSRRRGHGRRPSCCSRRSTGGATAGSCGRWGRGTRTGSRGWRGTSGWMSWTTRP